MYGTLADIWGFSWLMIVILFLLVVISQRGPWLRFLGRLLIVDNSVRESDAIVVLGGGQASRVHRALDLYRQGAAPCIVLTGGSTKSFGLERSWATLSQNLALQLDLPKEAIKPVDGCFSTYEEAVQIRQLAKENGLQSIVVVSDPAHGRRALRTFRTVLPGMHVRFSATPDSRYTPDQWWCNEAGIVQVQNEYLKLDFLLVQVWY